MDAKVGRWIVAQMQTRTVFVGRGAELRELLDQLDDTASGLGRLVLLGGEPGIGKSRLADELASRARERGHQVLWGRGWEDAGAPPYWPWVQALRGYLRSTDADDVRRHLGSGARDVAQMLPEVRDLLPDLRPPPDAGSESARFQLFDSTATFLRNAAHVHPVLVILDDLHAADTPSILLLRFLASQLGDMPVFVVGTYRDLELTPEHPLTSAIAEMAREPVTRIVALRGLDADAVGDFIEATANVAPHDHLVAAVWRETNGNPLFVGEAVRLLSAEGRLGDVADLSSLRVAVPAGRTGGDRPAHRAPERGQCARTRARRRAGSRIQPRDHSPGRRRTRAKWHWISSTKRSKPVCSRGSRACTVGTGSHTISCAKPCMTNCPLRVAHTSIGGSPGSSRRSMARLSKRISPRSPITSSLAAEVGDAGRPEGDEERAGPKAIDYARRAGDAAARSLAYEEAARFYGMALTVLELDEGADDGTRAETLLALGDAKARAGELDDARSSFLEAAEIARRTGIGQHLARAALGFGGRSRGRDPARTRA